jgi:hypothetical protein
MVTVDLFIDKLVKKLWTCKNEWKGEKPRYFGRTVKKAEKAPAALAPAKSEVKYTKEYDQFQQWLKK